MSYGHTHAQSETVAEETCHHLPRNRNQWNRTQNTKWKHLINLKKGWCGSVVMNTKKAPRPAQQIASLTKALPFKISLCALRAAAQIWEWMGWIARFQKNSSAFEANPTEFFIVRRDIRSMRRSCPRFGVFWKAFWKTESNAMFTRIPDCSDWSRTSSNHT